MSNMTSCLPEVPVTCERPPPTAPLPFDNPGQPRATLAISREKPNGTPGSPPTATVLQQHVLFWDTDGDGVIWPWDTYAGFRRLGFNPLLSLAAVGLHILAPFTSPTWFIHPLLPIHIKAIHRTKHGSDTEVYDTEGRFVPEKFEEMFSKYDRQGKGGLDFGDLSRMATAHMNVMDPFGWAASRGEWYALWLLCKDEHGVVSKEKIRAQYDGSLWQLIADEVEEAKQHKA